MNRQMFSGALALSTCLLGLVGLTTQAQAAFYGDYGTPGGFIVFRDVQDINGLYGAPTVVANSLNFAPTNFNVACSDSGACPPVPASVTDTLTFEIDADPGAFITRILLNEDGVTLLDNFDIPDTFAITTVAADVFIDILELNGAPVSGISLNAQMNFTSLGSYDTATEGNGTHSWSGLLSVNIDNLLAAGGYSGRATRIDVSIANMLTAYADTGAIASIGKDNVSGLAVKVIPEPGTAILLGLGLAGLAGAGSRRD